MNLNLSDLSKSDIKYKISQFPDGQQDIVINTSFDTIEINIQSRFNSFKDLELIICTVKALRRLRRYSIHLYIPYLLGARSDRHFQKGGNSYLVDVIAPIINSLDFVSITSLDVHSDVAAACIKNFRSISNLNLVKFAMSDIGGDNNIIISPDAGSEKKIYDILRQITFSDIIVAKKHRDIITGNITSTEVPLKLSYQSHQRNFVIIDDICDGGRTFIEIAKVLRNNKIDLKSNIYLIVTHGIFSGGYKDLNMWFDKVYCTNSVRNIGDYEGNDLVKTNVKQLNVI